MKTISDKQKLIEFTVSKSDLQQVLKEVLLAEKKNFQVGI